MNRRIFLQSGLAAAEIGIAAHAGLLWPMRVLASGWPSDAFFSESFDEAMAALFGNEPIQESDQVQMKAPDLAENGATVPVSVRTDFQGPFVLTLLSVDNPTPTVGRFDVSAQLESEIATRIKMAKTSEVVAVVTTGGNHYSTRKRIQVTTGGCS